MAKNDEIKNSGNDVELAAKDLLKKLSSQYDTDPADREKKMADTLDSIANDDQEDEKLSTVEFNKIFDKFTADENVVNAVGNGDTVGNATTSDMPIIHSETIEMPAANDERMNTNIYADRMTDEGTIASFKPDEAAKATQISDKTVEYRFAETGNVDNTESDDSKDPSETMMMQAFGLDTRRNVEKDDSKKIFSEYAFSSTDEMDVDPPMNTSTMDVDIVPDEKQESETVSAYEYTSPSQKKEIFSTFRSKYMSAKIRMIASAFLAIMLFVIEALPVINPEFDLFGENAFIAVLVDVCITIAASSLAFNSIVKAFMLLGKGKFSGDSVTAFSFCISMIVSMISVIATYLGEEGLVLYNFSFAVCVFFSIVFEFLALRRDIYSFKILSSSETKSVMTKLGRTEKSPEEKVFGEYIGDYSDVYRVRETDFVSDFFKKRKEVPSCTRILGILIPISVLIAVVAAVISATVLEYDVYTSISYGYMAYWFCAPVAALISFTYPMYLCSLRAYSYSSAIIGDATPECSERISAIAFDDCDAFPPERTKIKSVKVFENYHIENVIYFASSVFSKIGGPLATVFKQATLDSLNSESVEIKEITDLGIDAFVDGRHIVIGQSSYMESQCFETMYDPGDEDYEGNTNKRVLYLACDEVVVAKFYIQYTVSPDFLYIVRHLCREGICISIRSLDPCIDNDILPSNKIDLKEYPVCVIKGQEPAIKEEKISARDGAIISTGTRKGLVKTLLLCDKVMNIRKTNLIVKVLSIVIGMVAAGLIIFSGGSVSSVWPAVYQIFWMLPIFAVSKIYI